MAILSIDKLNAHGHLSLQTKPIPTAARILRSCRNTKRVEGGEPSESGAANGILAGESAGARIPHHAFRKAWTPARTDARGRVTVRPGSAARRGASRSRS